MSENQTVEKADQGFLGTLSASGCALASLTSAAFGGANLVAAALNAHQGRPGVALLSASVAALSLSIGFKYAHDALKISASDAVALERLAVAAEKAAIIVANENCVVAEPSRSAQPR